MSTVEGFDPSEDLRPAQQNVIGTIEGQTTFQTDLHYAYYLFGDVPLPAMSTLAGAGVTDEVEREILQLYVVDDAAAIERVLERLESLRVLLVVGEPHSGRSATALYLATRLAECHDLANETLVVNVDSHAALDVARLAAEKKRFGDRVTILPEALANSAVMTFFKGNERVHWQHFQEKLRNHRSYLILTACRNELTSFRTIAEPHLVLHELRQPGPQLLIDAFERRLEWLAGRGLDPKRLELARAHRDEIIAELRSIARVCDFISFFTSRESELAIALREFRDPRQWFNAELEKDVDAWCAAAALTLAQPVTAGAVAWSDFERLRRIVSERIRSDEEMFPANKETPPSGSAQGLGDRALLESCRAVVEKARSGLGDVVRFSEPSFSQALWNAMLSGHRRVLTRLTQSLRQIAEQDRTTARRDVRVLAAQALGRIGDVDPERLVIPLLRHWATGERKQRRFVGHLLQGIVASGNDASLAATLRELDSLAEDVLSAESASESPSTDVVTIIAAHALLGETRPDLAMKRLGRLAVEHLTPAVEGIQKVERESETLNTRARLRRGKTANALRRRGQLLAQLAEPVSREQGLALFALARAISGISLSRGDVIEILALTQDWMARGGQRTGVLVALLFLHDGIADAFDDFVENGKRLGVNVPHPILFALSLRPGAVDDLASFLADLHAAFHGTFTMPASLEKDLEDRFFECLEDWARDSLAHEESRKKMIELHLALTQVRGGELRSDVVEALKRPAFQNEPGLQAFAVDVRRRIRS